MFGLESGEEESISTRKDALPSRMKQDEEAVKKLVEQFNRFNAFRINHAAAVDDHQDVMPAHLPTYNLQHDHTENQDSVEVIDGQQQVRSRYNCG